MNNNRKDNNSEKKNVINPVSVAVTGAIIGAGVAGAILMSDKENQKKAKKVVNDAKEKLKGYKAGIKEKSQVAKEDVKVKMDQISGKVQKIVEVAKEPLKETK